MICIIKMYILLKLKSTFEKKGTSASVELSRFHIDKSMFSLVAWFGNLSLKNKNSFNPIVRWASKIIRESQLNLAGLCSSHLHIRDCCHCSHIYMLSFSSFPLDVGLWPLGRELDDIGILLYRQL